MARPGAASWPTKPAGALLLYRTITVKIAVTFGWIAYRYVQGRGRRRPPEQPREIESIDRIEVR